MEIITFKPEGNSCNVYAVINEDKAVLIDAGMDAAKVLSYLEERGVKPEFLLLTHGHYDHCMAAHEFALRGTKIYMGEDDKQLILRRRHIQPYLADKFVDFESEGLTDGQKLTLCGMEFLALSTAGHTEGGFCFVFENNIFSGDTLFLETVGRYDLPGGNKQSLKESIAKLFALKGEYKVLAGHGRPSELSHERAHNAVANGL